MSVVTKHAFLSPGYNSWSVWTSAGSQTLTNPGTSHRVLESLAYAVDKMAEQGWQVKNIYVDQGAPTLILLTREESVVE